MQRLKDYLPGLRIIKTVLAVLLCLVFFSLFHNSKPIYAGIACILMMKEDHKQTQIAGMNRVLGTLIGGVVSYGCLIVIEWTALHVNLYFMSLVIAFAVFIVLMICKLWQLDTYVYSMSGIITLIILLSYQNSYNNALQYVISRMLETIAGILIAFLVNKYVGFHPDGKEL